MAARAVASRGSTRAAQRERDYVHDAAARDGILDDFAGLVDSADEVAIRTLGG